MATTNVHVIIRGRVQGVWYRQSTLDQATALGLAGWVRNLTGGEVEAVFEGDQATVDRLLDWCRTGPPLAEVETVETRRSAPLGLTPPFEMRPTASLPEAT